jgi:HD-GYP domain-containing protein (c-di-GMP phosphodiesterase class II)
MEQLIIKLAAAINMRTLYPANHPRVLEAVQLVIAALTAILEEGETDSITFIIVGDDLAVGQTPLRKASLPKRQFVQILKRRGIERLTLAAGLDAEECDQLITALATNETPKSSPHVVLGRVELMLGDQQQAAATEPPGRELSAEQLEPVREAFGRFRSDRKLPLAAMEQLVWSFMDSLSQTTRSILPLAKLKEHDEYTFVHSVNVSLLVIAQARSFGIQSAMLHAFGMAGLLHDIGKLMVPLDVLNQPGKLEGQQWATMQSHAEQGAWYLSEMEAASPLSIVVAYEHHLRYDGKPNYPLTRVPRLPNLASRMTSIADAYDAMSTIRPYQKPKMREVALKALEERIDSFYDPLLVANFTRLIRG